MPTSPSCSRQSPLMSIAANEEQLAPRLRHSSINFYSNYCFGQMDCDDSNNINEQRQTKANRFCNNLEVDTDWKKTTLQPSAYKEMKQNSNYAIDDPSCSEYSSSIQRKPMPYPNSEINYNITENDLPENHLPSTSTNSKSKQFIYNQNQYYLGANNVEGRQYSSNNSSQFNAVFPRYPLNYSTFNSNSSQIAKLSSGIQKVQLWNQHNAPASFQSLQHDSGIQSMSHSSATSVISSIHAASQISNVSSLPDDYYGGIGGAGNLNEQQNALFQNIPSNFQYGNRENARKALIELIPLLTDLDEEVVCKALNIVQKIGVCDFDNLYNDPSIRECAIIDGLLHGLKTYKMNKKIIRLALCTLYRISSNRCFGLELIVQTIDKNGAKCLDNVLDSISIRDLSCYKYAILILHNLMTEPKISSQVIQHVRELQTLAQIVDWLDEKNEKFMAIIVDIIQHLVERSTEQKTLFFYLNGPVRLIRILKMAQYENLLSRTTKLLKCISNCNPKKIVEAGALEVLHLHLNHMSQRLVRDLLICLRDLSDVSIRDRDVSTLLRKLLQLLGTNDLKVKQMCAQILANLSANNKANKEFIVQNDIIDSAFFVLFESEALLKNVRDKNAHILEDIQDNILTILRSVCSGHDYSKHAQCEIMKKRPNGDILLQKLFQKRVVLLRKALRILYQTATNDANLPRFKEVYPSVTENSEPIVPYIKEIVESFHIAASHFNATPSVEGVNLADIIQDSMSILQSLSRDDFLLNTIVDYLMKCPIIPENGAPSILLPQYVIKDEKLQLCAISLFSELLRHPYIANTLAQDAKTMELLYQKARYGNTGNNISALAFRCLEWIRRNNERIFSQNPFMPDNGEKLEGYFSTPHCNQSSSLASALSNDGPDETFSNGAKLILREKLSSSIPIVDLKKTEVKNIMLPDSLGIAYTVPVNNKQFQSESVGPQPHYSTHSHNNYFYRNDENNCNKMLLSDNNGEQVTSTEGFYYLEPQSNHSSAMQETGGAGRCCTPVDNLLNTEVDSVQMHNYLTLNVSLEDQMMDTTGTTHSSTQDGFEALNDFEDFSLANAICGMTKP